MLPDTTIFRPVKQIPPVPVVESAESTEMQLLLVQATRAKLTLDGTLTADVTNILPVVLLPMVSRLAVMLPISVDVRPKLPADFVPRSTLVPDVGISNIEPDEVALTVLMIIKFWAMI